MKVISLPEIASRIRCRRSGKTFLAEFINQCKIEDAIIIPDGATNGEVFMDMFPNARIWEITRDNIRCACVEFDDICEIKTFPLSWWNAPYKGNGNLSEKSIGSESEDKK